MVTTARLATEDVATKTDVATDEAATVWVKAVVCKVCTGASDDDDPALLVLACC